MDVVRMSHPLFVGVGGGNDVFSATLAMSSMWRMGWRWESCALAGVLSPFHKHSNVEGDGTPGLYRIRRNSKRFLSRYDVGRKIAFADPYVVSMINRSNNHYGIEAIYGLSLTEGSAGVAQTLRALADRFDYFILVDIGGDILYDGRPEQPHEPQNHVLSPMFDSMVLRGFNDSGVPGILFEAGPGTDGELAPAALERAIAATALAEQPIDPNVIDWWEDLWRRHLEPIRPGRTVPMTVQASRESAPWMIVPYRARAHLASRRFYAYFDQVISTRLCRQFWLIDPKKIRNPFAVRCGGPLSWFEKTQVRRAHCNNECNLEYLDLCGELWQFLTPSPLLSPEDRAEIIRLALTENATGQVCDGTWMLQADWQAYRNGWADRFQVDETGEMVELRPLAKPL